MSDNYTSNKQAETEKKKQKKEKNSPKHATVQSVASDKTKQQLNNDLDKKKVLIVEDEHPLAHALELKLSHEGFSTQIVSDGAQALKKTKEYKPDIILLDLIMPRMDGFTFLEELKKTGAKISVIVLSNLGQDEDKKRAEQYGIKGYFVKANTPIADIIKTVKSEI